jgi:DUF2934 family protein
MSSRSRRRQRNTAFASGTATAAAGAACLSPFPRAMATQAPCGSLPTHDEIAVRAREIWERRGCPEGRDLDNWLTAETELNGRSD